MGSNPTLGSAICARQKKSGDEDQSRLSQALTMNPFPPRDGGPHLVDHHSHQPAWRRIHRSPFFWVAALCIMAAMIIYITTGNLSTGAAKTAPPSPALAP
jgi:hypothetical protein